MNTNYEQKIKEARTIEAMKNGYMGFGGKFATIAKRLGGSVVKQGGIYSDTTEFEDIFEEDKEEIQTMDEEEVTYEMGIHFDGLSNGTNLQIMIYYHLAEIMVYYEGQLVYKEASGELEAYVPFEQWENRINQFYDLAKKIERKNKPEDKKKNTQEKEKQKNKILENFRKKWGI
jgi:hypothetical protein